MSLRKARTCKLVANSDILHVGARRDGKLAKQCVWVRIFPYFNPFFTCYCCPLLFLVFPHGFCYFLSYFPKQCVHTRGSYGKCKGPGLIRVLTLVCGILPVNFCIKWLLWNFYSFIHFISFHFIHSFIRSFIRSFVHSFVRSFVHSFHTLLGFELSVAQLRRLAPISKKRKFWAQGSVKVITETKIRLRHRHRMSDIDKRLESELPAPAVGQGFQYWYEVRGFCNPVRWHIRWGIRSVATFMCSCVCGKGVMPSED